MSGAPEGVLIAAAALEYFEAQHAAEPSTWSGGRVSAARRDFALAVARAEVAA